MNRIDTNLPWHVLDTPIGPLTLVAGRHGLAQLRFPGQGGPLAAADRDPGALAGPAGQLEEYFAGERQAFEIDVELHGTEFQLSVWNALRELPFGTTVSYKALAERLGRADRVRAVGAAVGRTPVPIVVPCHRVVGSDGSLTGYGGGLDRKRALLDLEQSAVGQVSLL
jgi:methylated-DNA-[protein]-cysteine S-methyltransferase